MSTESIYNGSGYGISQDYSGLTPNLTGYQVNFSQMGFPSDPGTANQLAAVSKKLSTGSKVVEVSTVNIGRVPGDEMGIVDSIPKHHWKEIERLKKLVGAELTFHGPLVEPSGITKGLDDTNRQIAERHMFKAIKAAHEVEPNKNIPIVFHSSNIGIDTETYERDEKTKKMVPKEVVLLTEKGEQARIDLSKPDPITGEKLSQKELIENQNKDIWTRQLQGASYNAYQGQHILEVAEKQAGIAEADYNLYKTYTQEPKKFQKIISNLNDTGMQDKAHEIERKMQEITHGDLYVRNSYQELQNLFEQAEKSAKEWAQAGNKGPMQQLTSFRDRIGKKVKQLEKDPSKIVDFGNEVVNGINLLKVVSTKKTPEIFKPIKQTILDKSSETFANLAQRSYNEFEAKGKKSPIIAIENPPADRFALSSGEDLKMLIEQSRIKLKQKLKVQGLDDKKAEQQAEKLIGATWDTGHINVLQGKGFSKDEIMEQTKTIAPYVKHVHIADNFGMSDTELIPGSGNAQIKKTLQAFEEEFGKQGKDFSKIKKIVETGSWYSALQQQHTPVLESVKAFSSPVYGMKAAPYWSQAAEMLGVGSYMAGIGEINPSSHHAMYGLGFSNLPLELGGQIAGGGSRLSGTPMA